jgi:predicted small metal-binding protein
MQAACRDVSGIDCSFIAGGKSAQEVKNALYGHAAKFHSAVLAKATEKDKADMDKKMDQLLAGQK